jgi:excreted virulence factor EspC (type VII ESX diderm)
VTQSYEVDTAALSSHARTLNALSGELRSAFDGASVSLSGDAFGEIGQQVAAVLQAAGQSGQETISAGVQGLDAATTNIQVTAITYEQQETGAIDRFEAERDGLYSGGSASA